MNDYDNDYAKTAKHFGQSLKALCRDKNISISRLSEMADVSKSSLSAAVNGHSMPNLITLIRICGALQVSPDALLCMGSRTGDPQGMALSEKEEELVWLYRLLPDEKRRWMEETADMLKTYLPDRE